MGSCYNFTTLFKRELGTRGHIINIYQQFGICEESN
jgi:hypothetical protein